jgi:hypothetical protein
MFVSSSHFRVLKGHLDLVRYFRINVSAAKASDDHKIEKARDANVIPLDS